MNVMWKSYSRPIADVITKISALNAKIVTSYDPNFSRNRTFVMELMRTLIPLKIRGLPIRRHPCILLLLGANIGFKFIEMDKR